MKRLVKLILALIIAGGLTTLLAMPTRAASAVQVSDENLVASARAIVTGRVTYIESRWDSQRNNVYTDITVSLTGVIKGSFNTKEIVIEQVGGHYGHQQSWLIGSPQFKLHEEVLLFLNTDATGVLHTAHLSMGKFSLQTDRATGQRQLLQPSLAGHLRIDDANQFIAHIQQLSNLTVANQNATPLLTTPPQYTRGRGEIQPEFTTLGARFFEPDSDMPVTFFVNPDRAPVSGGGVAETDRAIVAWNNAGSRLKLADGGTTTLCGQAMDRKSVVSFEDCLKQLDDPVNGEGVIASAMMIIGDDFRIINGKMYKQILESDIVFNNGFANLLSVPNNLSEIIAHELGNAFGLDNSSNDPKEPDPVLREAIMYFKPHLDGRGPSLNTDDLAGVLNIYPFFTSVQFTNPTVPAPVINVPYNVQLQVANGFPGYKFVLTDGRLPAGLMLSDAARLLVRQP